MRKVSTIRRLANKARMKWAKRFVVSRNAWVLEALIRSFEDLYCHITGKEIIECFGDSHAGVFWGLNRNERSKYYFRVVSVRGATAQGLGNPNSQTNALNIFKFWLERISKQHNVLFLMGEVDVGFLLWLRVQKYNLSPERCLNELIGKYTDFLQGVMVDHKHLLVCSAPLPTLKNYDFMADNDVAKARRSIKTGQLERTKMTLRFNHEMKKWADVHGALFLDLDVYAYDEATGLVKEDLVNKQWLDHHYNQIAYQQIILQGMMQSGIIPVANA